MWCGEQTGQSDHSPPSAADTATLLSVHMWSKQGQTYVLNLSYPEKSQEVLASLFTDRTQYVSAPAGFQTSYFIACTK